MKVLIACEYSGVVRDAFMRYGHDAISCDLLPSIGTLGQAFHYQGDVFDIIHAGWDLMIAHPPCTFLCGSAEWAYDDKPTIKGKPRNMKPGTLIGSNRRAARVEALTFVSRLMAAPIEKIAIENPVGKIGTEIRKAEQYVQPYEYGDDASKKTGLWLKNLPPLRPTEFIEPRYVCKCGTVYEYKLGKFGCFNCRGEFGPSLMRWANQTDSGQNREPPHKDRWKTRSNTWPGIAAAMAQQWGA